MPNTADTVRKRTMVQARELIDLAPGRSVPEKIEAAATVLRLPVDRVKKYWYGIVRMISPSEEELIRACYESAKKLTEARDSYAKMYNELLGDNPTMAKLAPSPMEDDSLSNEARALAQSHFGARRHGRVA